MCDYSLMNVPNRLATENEELVAHRFPSGALGFASLASICRKAIPTASTRRNFWATVHDFFAGTKTQSDPVIPAVCIPPGARLQGSFSPHQQASLGVRQTETVTFTQITAATNSYRDAIRLPNGKEVRLQELQEGQRFTVLDLSCADELDLKTLNLELARRETARSAR